MRNKCLDLHRITFKYISCHRASYIGGDIQQTQNEMQRLTNTADGQIAPIDMLRIDSYSKKIFFPVVPFHILKL